MIKLPEQFRGIFDGSAGKPLDEGIGQQLAQWAAGADLPKPPTVAEYEACATRAALEQLEVRRSAAWVSLSASQKKPLKAASEAATSRLATPASDGFGPAAALTKIKEAGDAAVLEQAWSSICNQCDAQSIEIPNEVHAAYTFAKESLG